MSQNNANQQLNDLLVTRNFEPQALDAQGKPAASPDQATLFSFDYKGESGKDYGTVVIMFNGKDMDVYFGDNVGKSMEPEDKKGWFDGFLYQIRQFAKRNVPGTFNLKDLNKLKYSMAGQAAIKEGLFESWQGKKDVSYNADATQARLMIKHKRNIGEGEARYRNIQSLFIETADGERFKLPFTKLSAGRAMLEHVRQGGKPYDIRGNHIVTIVNEMNLLSRFKRANQGKIFEGETQHLVEQATHYYETLQNNLKSLSTKNGYSKYFESWDPAVVTDEDVIIEDLRHMFIEQNIDSRVEQALPLLAKLQKQDTKMKEADIFESYVNLMLEGTWAIPDTKEKQSQLVSLLSQELPVGPDASNATEQLYNLLGDDELFDRLEELAEKDADADARTIIISRLEELKSNHDIAQVIGQLKTPTPPQEPVQEGQYCPDCHENPCKCGITESVKRSLRESAGDVMFKDQERLDRLESLRGFAKAVGNTTKAEELDRQIKAIYAANPVGSQDKGHLEEFAPGAGHGDEDHLQKLAKQWAHAEDDYDVQEKIEQELAKFGYGISEIEDGSEAVQLVPTGEYMLDWNDNDIIVFNPEDLNEGVCTECSCAPCSCETDPADHYRNKAELTPLYALKKKALEEDSGIESAILRRIMHSHTDILSKYGPQAVMNAAREEAEWIGDVDEIGTSDISAAVSSVIKNLESSHPVGEGTIGKTLGFAAGEIIAPEIPGSGIVGAHIGDKLGDKISNLFSKKDSEEVDEDKYNDPLGYNVATSKAALMLGYNRFIDVPQSKMAELRALADKIQKEKHSGKNAELEEKASFPASRHPETGVIIGGRKEGAKAFGGDKEYDTLADRRTPGHEVPHAKAMGWKNSDEKAEQGKLKSALKKTQGRLEESGMGEVDLLLQEIARGSVDIYDIYANPKTNVEKFVSEQIHEKAEEVAREQGYHLKDDIEQVLERIQRELEVEYGADDNMEIELETDAAGALSNETVGGGNFLESTALTGQYGHSGKLQAVEGIDEDMTARIKFLAGIKE